MTSKTIIPIEIQNKREKKSILVLNNPNNQQPKSSIKKLQSKYMPINKSILGTNSANTTNIDVRSNSVHLQKRNISQTVKRDQEVVHIQNLSPIKPSFVNPKDEQHITINSQQFSHSTPTHHLTKSPIRSASDKNVRLPIRKVISNANTMNSTSNMNEQSNKKRLIVKELARKILELNGYRTKTEQLNNELHESMRMKKESKKSSQDYSSITQRTDEIEAELFKLNGEMLQKIKDIHQLENELGKIQGGSETMFYKPLKPNIFDKEPIDFSTLPIQRNEEVMHEIHNMLKEMSNNSEQEENSNLTVTKTYEEYHKSSTHHLSSSPSHKNTNIQKELFKKTESFKSQLEDNLGFVKLQAVNLESYFFKSNNFDRCVIEFENFKRLIKSIKERISKDKRDLFKFISKANENNQLDVNLVNNITNEIEMNIANMLMHFENYLNNFESLLPAQVIIESKKDGTDSSFLTEEEEAIRKISDRIKVLKERINSRQTMPKMRKLKKSRSKNSDSCLNNSSSSEDTDTKELLHLNEQIKVLKNKMIAKGNQLNRLKSRSNSNSRSRLPSSEKIYLPINHSFKQSYYDENESISRHGIQIEDINEANQSYDEQESNIHRRKSSNEEKARVYYVNKSECEELSSWSPERKYTTSIEIPAEQLEMLKGSKNCQTKTTFRSKSVSSSVASVYEEKSSSSSKENQNEVKKKRNKSAVHFEKPNNNVQYYISKSQLRTPEIQLKVHHSEKQTMTDPVKFEESDSEKKALKNDLLKSNKELDELRLQLNEKNNAIQNQINEYKIKLEKYEVEIEKQNRKNESLIKLLEDKSKEVTVLNDKLIETEKLCKELQASNETNKLMFENLLKSRQQDELEKKEQTEIPAPTKIDDMKATPQTTKLPENEKEKVKVNLDELNETVLMCNIPEHHRLEDIVHQNREEISNLKMNLQFNQNIEPVTPMVATAAENSFINNRLYFDEIALLEKKAEFEALDLAINDRRKQLYEIEMKKRRHLNNASFLQESSTSYLQDELICIEETLHKRNKQLCEMEILIRCSRKELASLKETKVQLENEIGCLKKKSTQVSQEINMIDKKADEATIELIVTKEELESLKEQKSVLTADIEAMKTELVDYIKTIKSSALNSLENEEYSKKSDFGIDEIKQTISDQRNLLESLNEEIFIKKKEIDTLRDQSNSYVKQLKQQGQQYENEMNQARLKKEDMINEFRKYRQQLEIIDNELDMKAKILEEKKSEIEQIEKLLKKLKLQRDDELKKMESMDRFLKDKYVEIETIEINIKKSNQNLTSLKKNEEDLVKELQRLDKISSNEERKIEKSKEIYEELNGNMEELQEKLKHLTNEYNKLDNEYEKKEAQYTKMNNLVKDKQNLINKDQDKLDELDYEKTNLNQDILQLKEAFKVKKSDLESIDQKILSSQSEINAISLKLTDLTRQLGIKTEELKQMESKLKELNNKIINKESYCEQLDEKFNEKKGEFEKLISYIEEINNEILDEKRQLNYFQNECSKQKIQNEELLNKYESLTNEMETLHENISKTQESKQVMDFRIKQNKELEAKLNEKSQQIEYLKEAFYNGQEEIKLFKSKLKDLEDVMLNQFHSIDHYQNIDQLSLKKSSVYSMEESDYSMLKTHQSKPINNSSLQPKSLISSLLITPKLRVNSSQLETTKMPMISPESALFSDEQSEYKEKLAKNFEEKLNNLERSKTQTQNVIENLKLNLNQIEMFTANNIFKLTNFS